ncbi:hypothetical protein QJQ45_017285 [Haematococcus lacustris]|nr:hypothetical protein QJQ45_017285 [Haematococcus lacustris]
MDVGITSQGITWRCLSAEGARLGDPVCSGLGDRIRGSLFLFRVAAMSRRLVIIKSEHPSPLKDYLKPSGIVDWLPYDITALPTHVDVGFKVAVQRAEQHFKELRLTPQQPYTAIHLRLGGSMGEATSLDRDKALQLVLSSSLCARRLAQQHGYEGPVVMVTDHAILRQFIAAGMLQNVTVTKMIPHHFDQALDALDGLVDIVSDLVVLSHAKCQVCARAPALMLPGWNVTCVDELWKIGTVPRIMRSSDVGADGSQLDPTWPAIHAVPAAATAIAQQLSQRPPVAACLAQLRSSWDEQVAAAAAGGRTTAVVPLCDSPSVLHDVTLLLTHLAR